MPREATTLFSAASLRPHNPRSATTNEDRGGERLPYRHAKRTGVRAFYLPAPPFFRVPVASLDRRATGSSDAPGSLLGP